MVNCPRSFFKKENEQPGLSQKVKEMTQYAIKGKGEFLDWVENPKNEDFLAMHQVGGEIDSALAAAHTAMSVGLPITIVYDYLGVEMWATGEWKRNKPFTQKYHHLMNIYITPVIDVTFEKVKSHTGIQFNDFADVLAKYACDVINGEALFKYFNGHGYELHPVAWVGPDENDTDHEIVYLELVETSKE